MTKTERKREAILVLAELGKHSVAMDRLDTMVWNAFGVGILIGTAISTVILLATKIC